MPDKYDQMTMTELQRSAQTLGVAGHAQLTKDQLIAACRAAEAGEDGAAVAREMAEQASSAQASAATAGPDPVSSGGTPPVTHEAPPAAPTYRSAVEAAFDFPQSYGVDRVVLLVRDPAYLYCYWDCTQASWDLIHERGLAQPDSGWQPVLRVHDVTLTSDDRAAEHTVIQIIELHPEARDYYLATPLPERRYRVEHGYRSGGGDFVGLGLSNLVASPRTAPADDAAGDIEWGYLPDMALQLSVGSHAGATGQVRPGDLFAGVDRLHAGSGGMLANLPTSSAAVLSEDERGALRRHLESNTSSGLQGRGPSTPAG